MKIKIKKSILKEAVRNILKQSRIDRMAQRLMQSINNCQVAEKTDGQITIAANKNNDIQKIKQTGLSIGFRIADVFEDKYEPQKIFITFEYK